MARFSPNKGQKGDPGVVILTQEEYDAIDPDPETLYVISG